MRAGLGLAHPDDCIGSDQRALHGVLQVALTSWEACQSLLLKMRDEGVVKFDIHSGRWHLG
jgi:hypothetical protein